MVWNVLVMKELGIGKNGRGMEDGSGTNQEDSWPSDEYRPQALFEKSTTMTSLVKIGSASSRRDRCGLEPELFSRLAIRPAHGLQSAVEVFSSHLRRMEITEAV